ncbi:MAG: ribose-phosphate diphosphokinase, partial [Elusimicrobia bacterium]|nr:ribose-phosphate diphosphokinase [Elusimicrobiota bacterium]
LIIIDALHRASAKSVTAVMPYYGYGRQDRKAEPRVPITAKLIANLITASGANRVVALDMHAGQLQGFFDIPVDNLYATPVFLEYLKGRNFTARAGRTCVVSPDAGGVERARAFGKKLRASLVIVDKRRPVPNKSSVMHVIGDVKNKTTLVLDDIVDTAGTLLKVSAALKKAGAGEVIALATHGILSGNAVENIDRSEISRLVITDSIPLSKKSKKIIVLPVAGLLGRAIRRINDCESVSELFV